MSHLGPAIAAISSPPGFSGRGLVRASGRALAASLPALIDPVPPARTWQACRLNKGSDLAGLPVLAAWMAGPGSYTSQDVLEIQAPGHPALLDRLLDRVIAWLKQTDDQARLAEPGEFTRRAFLSGKIDLTQAEGIAATIAAETRIQVEAAGLLRSGRLGQVATGLTDRLAGLLALVEAGIDFSDQDDVVAIAPADLERGLKEILEDCHRWLHMSRLADEWNGLPQVVLAGVPNVGKSTLFNALAGYERAVSSDRPGSTRDVLIEPMAVPVSENRSRQILLVDMAGLDAASGGLAQAMQTAAHRAIGRADLVLLLESEGLPGRPEAACGKPHLRVWTQADRFRPPEGWTGCVVAARSGDGLENLKQAISSAIDKTEGSFGPGIWALQQRNRQALQRATDALKQAAGLAAAGRPEAPELAAEAMRRALDAIGVAGGHRDPDEVIGLVFAKFCVGK